MGREGVMQGISIGIGMKLGRCRRQFPSVLMWRIS